MKSLVLALAALLLFYPASSQAVGDFEKNIIKNLDEIGRNALANEAELVQLQKSISSYEASQKELGCMIQIQSNLRELYRSTHLLSDLAGITSMMENRRDQIRVNAYLSKELEAEKAGLGLIENSVKVAQKRCNTMLVVNYAQRTLNLSKLVNPEIQKLQYFLAPLLAE